MKVILPHQDQVKELIQRTADTQEDDFMSNFLQVKVIRHPKPDILIRCKALDLYGLLFLFLFKKRSRITA